MRDTLVTIGVLVGFAIQGLAQEPLRTWYTRSGYPTRQDLYSCATDGQRLVCAGSGGTFIASTNGTDWTVATNGSASSVFALSYGDEIFLAAGASGVLMTSADGLQWSVANSGTTQALRGIASADGKSVVVGDAGTILTSTDGTNWAMQQITGSGTLRAVAGGNNLFAAVGDSTLVSSDGIAWSQYSTPASMVSIAFAIGKFVAISKTAAYVSSNGFDWVTQTIPRSTNLAAVAWIGDRFVVVGGRGRILVSTDGNDWQTSESPADVDLNSVGSFAGRVAVVANGGLVATSRDLANWTMFYGGSGSWGDAVTYGNGLFVAVTEAGMILTSTDGKRWNWRKSPLKTALRAISYGNGMFVAGGDSTPFVDSYRNKVFSRDGIHWEVVPKQPSGNFSNSPDVMDIIHDDTEFVAMTTYNAGNPAVTQTSSDGTNWIARSVVYNNFGSGICRGKDVFVAGMLPQYAGSDSAPMYWTNSDNQTFAWMPGSITPKPHVAIQKLAYGAGRFVGVSSANWSYPTTTAVSTDGVSWVSQELTGEYWHGRVAFGNGFFVSGGATSILCSSNGMDWVRCGPPGGQHACFGRRTFVVVGSDGLILQSAFFGPPLLDASFRANRGVEVSVSAEAGKLCSIEASTNLLNWERIHSFVAETNSERHLDAAATNYPNRFYRAVAAENAVAAQ